MRPLITIKNTTNRTTVWGTISVVLLLAGLASAAQPPKPRTNPRERGEAPYDTGRQMRDVDREHPAQQADLAVQGAAADIDSKLRVVLAEVNAGRTLRPEAIQVANESLREAKKSLANFTDQEKCQYYLLSTWTDYFAGQLRRAMLNAAKAVKTDPQNPDAQATHTAMALVNGEFRLVASTKKDRPRDTIFQQESPSQYSTGQSGEQGGILQFSPDSLQPGLLTRKVEPMQLSCLNGTIFPCDPQTTTLCVLFWKLPLQEQQEDLTWLRSGSRDRESEFDLRGRTTTTSQTGSYDSQSSEQMQAFANLFINSFGNSRVRFVAANVDSLQLRTRVMAALLENAWPWAQVMAAETANAAVGRLLQTSSSEPVLVITCPGGSVCYAGPVTGFLPLLLLRHFGTTGQMPAATESSAGIEEPAETGELPASQEITTPDKPGSETPADINSPALGRRVETAPPKPTASAVSPPATSDEQLYPQAEDWYQMALFHKKSAAKLPLLSYKKLVDYCRMILENYPQSPQAQKARQLLRELPEEYRKKYNVTNQEMGL